MDRGELLQNVGFAFCVDDGEPPCKKVCVVCRDQATRVIDLVLEEAAKVATLAALKTPKPRTKRLGLIREPMPHEIGNYVAAAIRALKGDQPCE